jgi:hypothetical protein
MSVNLPVVNAPYLNVSNLELAIASDETLTMAAGRARNSSNEADIILSAAVTVSNIVSGYNGLDTGTVAASRVYAVYVIGDSSLNNPEGGILSLDQDEPLLPFGYDMYRKIGYAVTDATSDFLAGYWYGSANERMWVYDVPLATAVTAGNSATYAAVTLTNMAPSQQNVPVIFELDWTANAAADVLGLQPFSATGDVYRNIAAIAGATAHTILYPVVMAQLDSGVPKVNYKVSAGTVAIDVSGFYISI